MMSANPISNVPIHSFDHVMGPALVALIDPADRFCHGQAWLFRRCFGGQLNHPAPGNP